MSAPTAAKSRRPSAAQNSVTRAMLASIVSVMATEPRAPSPTALGRRRRLLGLGPGGTEREVHLERHAQVGGSAHHVERERAHLVVLGGRHLEDDLVVHLQDDAALEAALVERLVQPDQRHLE